MRRLPAAADHLAIGAQARAQRPRDRHSIRFVVRGQQQLDALYGFLPVCDPDVRQDWKVLSEPTLVVGSSVEQFFDPFTIHEVTPLTARQYAPSNDCAM